jgi:hypothetical protein
MKGKGEDKRKGTSTKIERDGEKQKNDEVKSDRVHKSLIVYEF